MAERFCSLNNLTIAPKSLDINYGLGEGLRQMVADASVHSPALISIREFLGLGTQIGVWCGAGPECRTPPKEQ